MAKLPSRSHGDTQPLTYSVNPPLQNLDVSSNFPDDVITEILCHLPVKPLLCFRCVSKSWCSLIDSPPFISEHLNRSVECKSNCGMIARHSCYYSIDFDSLYDATATKISEPLKTRLEGFKVMGSCNGLLCLCSTDAYDPSMNMILWNPATRKCRVLPSAPTNFASPLDLSRQFSFCGFGYDSLSDDYKIVRIDDSCDVSDSKVIVYRLKTNLWRQVQNIQSNTWKRVQNNPYYFGFSGVWGIFVGGALHWIQVKTLGLQSFPLVIAFDLKVEKYRELPMPKSPNDIVNMILTVFGECLCILDNYPNLRVDIWVMNKHAVENSWSKLFSIEHQTVSYFYFIRPLAYSKNLKDVLLEVDNDSVMWYNLETEKVNYVMIWGIPDLFELEVYTESLVQLDDDSSFDRKQVQKHKERKNSSNSKRRNSWVKFRVRKFKLLLYLTRRKRMTNQIK